MDTSRKAAPKTNDEGEEIYGGMTYTADIMPRIYTALTRKGFRLLPSRYGTFAGHQPYILTPLEANPDLKGWKQVATKNELLAFKGAFKSVVQDIINDDDQSKELAVKIILAGMETPGNESTAMHQIGRHDAEYEKSIFTRSFIGSTLPSVHKQIPSVSWFPKLVDLDPLELLTLFPKPEARAMMLLLGRTILGVGGTVTTEGTIQHRMRAAGIVVGEQAGLGKSTFLTYLLTALTDLGYTSTTIGKAKGKFGMGKIAEADLAFKDDLTSEEQKALLANIDMKTIITGGVINAEDKGLNATNVESKATIIAFTNVYVKSHFYSMDSGSIDRFNFLYTYNQEELTSHYAFDARTEPNYQRLAKKYNVSINQLTTYLLARSAEYFLDTIGMEYREEQLTKIEGRGCGLEAEWGRLQQLFFYKPYVSHTEKLVTNIAELCALAVALARTATRNEPDKMLRNLVKSDFSFNLMVQALLHFKDNTDDVLYNLQDVKAECRESITDNKLSELLNRKNLAEAFKTCTDEIYTHDGSCYPHTLSLYTKFWEQKRKDIPSMVDKYADVLGDISKPTAKILGVLNDIYTK